MWWTVVTDQPVLSLIGICLEYGSLQVLHADSHPIVMIEDRGSSHQHVGSSCHCHGSVGLINGLIVNRRVVALLSGFKFCLKFADIFDTRIGYQRTPWFRAGSA